MKFAKKIVTGLMLTLAFSLVGAVGGFCIGVLYVFLSATGFFTDWQALESDIRFRYIENATSKSIWARSLDDKLYRWDFHCYADTNCASWIQDNEIPDNIHSAGEREIKRNKNCQTGSISPIFLPSNIADCVEAGFSGPGHGSTIYYALLEDGTIHTWSNGMSIIFVTVVPIFFAFGGFILGLVVYIISGISRNRKKQSNQPSVE